MRKFRRSTYRKRTSSFTANVRVEHEDPNEHEQRYISRLMNLPSNIYWQILIIMSIIAQVYSVAWQMVFANLIENLHVNFLYYGNELLFFVDTILIVVHRIYDKQHRNSYKGKEPLYLISISVLTLLPYYELYLLLVTVDSYNLEFYIRIKVIPRILKVFFYFATKRKTAGLNQLIVLMGYHIFIDTSCAFILSLFWYNLMCENCEKPNWTDHLEDYIYDKSSKFDIFILCYTTMSNILSHNWNGVSRAEGVPGKLVESLIMLCGQVLHLMMFVGQLTSEYINIHKKQSTFNNRLTLITDYLTRHNVDKKLAGDIIEYYNVLWDKRTGFDKMPETFYLLPLSLQKEVTVDIFWDALRHSHIFGNIDLAFKREISLVMRCEFLNPNELLYKTDDSKYKMVYIISGILQILSDEDDESPIASFSSGTVLGEMSLLMPMHSIAYVKCATFCELHTIVTSDLYRKLSLYHGRKVTFKRELENRLQMAKCYKERMLRQKVIYNIYGVEEKIDRPIRRLKAQWRTLWRFQKKSEKVSNFKANDYYIQDHTARYLDLLVLCDEMDLKVEVVCLTGSLPFILHPDSSFRRFCFNLSLGAVVIESIFIPYYVAFTREITGHCRTVCVVLDFVYIFDICIQLTTAIKKKDTLVSNLGEIFLLRIRQFSFQVDLAATIPIDYLLMALGSDNHTIALFKIPRILKLYKLLNVIHANEKLLGTSSLVIKIFKYLVRYLLTVYFFVCYIYMTSCFRKKCRKYSWYPYNLVLIDRFNSSNLRNIGRFGRTTYLITSLILGLGTHEDYPFTIVDMISVHFIIIIGYYLFTFCYSELTATEYWLHHTEKQLFDKSYIMRRFAKLKKLPSSVQRSISEFMLFRWDYNHNTAFEFGPKGIFKDLPKRIKKRLVHHQIETVLLNTDLFRDCKPELIKELAGVAKCENYPAGALLAKAHYYPSYLHIIRKGFCSMESFVPGDKERGHYKIITGPGKCLPMECLHFIDSFVTITTITCVESITIPFINIRKIFSVYAMDNAILQEALKGHMKQHWSILTRQPARMTELLHNPKKEPVGYGDHFKYTLPNINIYQTTKKSHDRIILGFLFLRTSINPYGQFFRYWEIIRCILASLQFILLVLYLNILISYRKTLGPVFICMDVSVYADMYIKLNIHYYNQHNILVTHPGYAMGYYFKHAMLLDFWSIFPFAELRMHQLFSNTSTNEEALLIMLLITRPFQMYRVFHGYNLLSVKFKVLTGNTGLFIKSIIAVLIILLIFANFAILLSCNAVNDIIECEEHSWITHSNGGEHIYNVNVLVYGFNFVLGLFTYSSYGMFSAQNNKECLVLEVFVIILCVIRWVMFAKCTSAGLHSALTASKGQNNMIKFLRYCKKEFVDESVVTRIVDTYEHINQYKDTIALNLAAELFPPVLLNDFSFNVYKDALENTKIMYGETESFYRYLSNQVTRKLFKKDEIVIRCNDIQDTLYIIKKGRIDITVANTRLASLGVGGMFGCFEEHSKIRQTITATAKIHSEVMEINSRVFHAAIATKPEIVRNLRTLKQCGSEYIEAVHAEKTSRKGGKHDSEISNGSLDFEDKVSQTSSSEAENKSMRSKSQIASSKFPFNALLKMKRGRAILRNKLIRSYLKKGSTYLKIYEYVLNVHLAPLSTLHCFIMQQTSMIAPTSIGHNVMMYAVDLVFYIKIAIGFCLPYVDEDSGVLIVEYSSIANRYMKSQLFVDVFTVLPFELFARFVFTYSDFGVTIFALNRLGRIYFLAKYYNERLRKQSMRHHLRWTYLLYLSLFYIQFFTNIWNTAACYFQLCSQVTTIGHTKVSFEQTNSTEMSTMMSYVYVINIVTTTGLKGIQPSTSSQLLVTAMISFFTIYFIAIVTSGFTIIQIIDNYSLSVYEYKTLQVRMYLQNQSLSPALLTKVWVYFLHLWSEQGGEHLPSIIRNSNDILKQDIMYDVYSHHLRKHYLFANTHVDFLRQLMLYVKRCTYPQDYIIVEKGDVDGCMYFIHAGIVSVVETVKAIEREIQVLLTGNSFGEGQGFMYCPHPFTYKAKTLVDLLILDLRDWNFLLKYFPASAEEIKNQAQSQGLYFD